MTKEQKAELDRLTEHYRASFTPDVNQGLARLHRAIESSSVSVASQVPATNQRRWFMVAASVAALALATLAVVRFGNFGAQTFATTTEPRSFVLPDGSEVLLNRYSELRVAADYGSEARTVKLRGEGFFSVQPNADQPFLVQQENVTLRVVGTSFNLKAIPRQAFFEVEVATGKVLLGDGAETLPVAALECGRYDKADGLKRMAAPHLNRHAWRTHRLIFRDTPFSEALELVERSYDIQIQVDPAHLASCDFTFSSEFVDAELEEVLSTLGRLCGGAIATVDENAGVYRVEDWCKDPN